MPTDSRPAMTPQSPAVALAVGTTVAGETIEPTADEVGTLAAPPIPSVLDVDALREVAALIKERSDEFTREFYARLFLLEPDTRALFPVAMQRQQLRFAAALGRILDSIDDPEVLVPYVKALGRDHRRFGDITRFYAGFGAALVLALRAVGRARWTPRHEAAFIDAYDSVARLMAAGAAEDAVISPPYWDASVMFHRRVLDDVAVIQVRPHTSYAYRPGQYCSVMTPRRPNMWRPYCLASAPREDGLLDFHVSATTVGWVSTALVWLTEPGDVLRLGAPRGFDLASPRYERDLLCIAAGTGIGPILAALQELEERQDGRRVHVFYAGRNRSRLYALPHLESIGTRYRRLTVVPVLPPENELDRSADILSDVVGSYADWRQHTVFVAGPSATVQQTVDRLPDMGVAEEQIVYEDFGAG